MSSSSRLSLRTSKSKRRTSIIKTNSTSVFRISKLTAAATAPPTAFNDRQCATFAAMSASRQRFPELFAETGQRLRSPTKPTVLMPCAPTSISGFIIFWAACKLKTMRRKRVSDPLLTPCRVAVNRFKAGALTCVSGNCPVTLNNLPGKTFTRTDFAMAARGGPDIRINDRMIFAPPGQITVLFFTEAACRTISASAPASFLNK